MLSRPQAGIPYKLLEKHFRRQALITRRFEQFKQVDSIRTQARDKLLTRYSEHVCLCARASMKACMHTGRSRVTLCTCLQIRPFVQAAFEAVSRINTPKCVLRTVDMDFNMGACLRMALAAYGNLRTLVLAELNIYDEAVLQLAG